MEKEDSSEDGTSADNLTPNETSECYLCKTDLDQLKGIICEICGGLLCAMCSTVSERTNATICVKCQQYIYILNENNKKKLSELTSQNTSIMLSIMQSQQLIQTAKNKLKSKYLESALVEKLNNDTDKLKADFKDSFSVLLQNHKEKQAISLEINEKQCKLLDKEKETTKLKKEIQEKYVELSQTHQDKEIVLMDSKELTIENQILIEKIKDIKDEHFIYNKELLEAMKALKAQMQQEIGVVPLAKTNNPFRKNHLDELNIIKERIKLDILTVKTSIGQLAEETLLKNSSYTSIINKSGNT